MTPLPTATGRPASRGLRICSTEAKKASMSTWSISDGRFPIEKGEAGPDLDSEFIGCPFAGAPILANICSHRTPLVGECGFTIPCPRRGGASPWRRIRRNRRGSEIGAYLQICTGSPLGKGKLSWKHCTEAASTTTGSKP